MKIKSYKEQLRPGPKKVDLYLSTFVLISIVLTSVCSTNFSLTYDNTHILEKLPTKSRRSCWVLPVHATLSRYLVAPLYLATRLLKQEMGLSYSIANNNYKCTCMQQTLNIALHANLQQQELNLYGAREPYRWVYIRCVHDPMCPQPNVSMTCCVHGPLCAWPNVST